MAARQARLILLKLTAALLFLPQTCMALSLSQVSDEAALRSLAEKYFAAFAREDADSLSALSGV